MNEGPNSFVATASEHRLLCVFCRRRLGLGSDCIEYYERARKPQVAHRQCDPTYRDTKESP